jgi:hypothetical protein
LRRLKRGAWISEKLSSLGIMFKNGGEGKRKTKTKTKTEKIQKKTKRKIKIFNIMRLVSWDKALSAKY